MFTEIITSLASLSALEPVWDQLLFTSSFRTPFQTFAWQQTVTRYKELPENLFIVAVYDGQLLIGLAPLCYDRTREGKRLIRWLGAGEGVSDYQGCIIRTGYEAEFYSSLFAELQERAADWDEICLTEVPAALQDTAELIRHIQNAGLYVYPLHESVTCRMPLPDTWEEYLTTLTPKFRGNLENKARNIAKMPAVQFVDLAVTHRWQAGMEALFDLHQQRWISKGEEGVFSDETTRRMHLEIVEKFRQQGLVRLPAFVSGDQILAVNYSLCMGDTNYSYLSSYTVDDAWSKYSLGVQIRRASVFEAIKNGYKVYDFLRGDESYKLSFGASLSENLDFHIFSSKSRFLLFKTLYTIADYQWPVPAPVKLFVKKYVLHQ